MGQISSNHRLHQFYLPPSSSLSLVVFGYEQVCVIAMSCARLYLQGLKFQCFFIDLFVMFSVENLRGFIPA